MRQRWLFHHFLFKILLGARKNIEITEEIYSICGSVYVGKSKASSIQQLELSMKFSKVKIYKEYKRISYI